jgi:hypothetical protein
MSLTGTTLVGAITANANQIKVASSTGFVRGQTAQIDAEQVCLQGQNPAAPEYWTVMRGYNGTRAVPHTNGAAVVTGIAEDWAVPVPPSVYSYGADATIPALAGLHELNTGAATVFDIAAPGLDQDGLVLIITAKTAHAYEVHSALAFLGEGAGEDEAVFGGAIGDNFALVAQNGRWLVLSAQNVTFAT